MWFGMIIRELRTLPEKLYPADGGSQRLVAGKADGQSPEQADGGYERGGAPVEQRRLISKKVFQSTECSAVQK